MALTKPLAINPLPWTMAAGFGPLAEETVRSTLADLAGTGFRAMHSDVPPTMSPRAYQDLLAEFGFLPAPGYFTADFADAGAFAETKQNALAHARTIAALGVDTTFVAGWMSMPRLMRPAVGEAASREALKRSAAALADIADAAMGEGVRFALHPHIGMSIETEQETRTVLDETAGSALGFGPDTGHLFWAGTVPHHIIADYADRVAAVHLKDVDLRALQQATRYNDDYMTATNVRHVWAEPGTGAVNFPAVLSALPADFDGWLIVEVDVPHAADRLESTHMSHRYLSTLLGSEAAA